MKKHFNNFLERYWYVMFILAGIMYLIAGCTSTDDVKSGLSITKDTITEKVPEIANKVVEGDYVGAIVAVVTAVVGGVGAYFAARKIRDNKKKKKEAK